MDMSNSNIPTLPLDFTSTQGNKRKKNQAKQQKPNYRSSSNIQCKPQYQIVNNRQTQLPPDYYSSLVDKQLLDEYQHISNQQIVQTQQKIQQFKYMKKQKNEAQFQQYDSSPIPQRQVQRDYRRNVPFQGNRAQNNQRQYQEPEQFRNIMQCNTIEDQQQDDSSPKHPKSVQVLRGKHSRHPQNYYNQHQYIQKQQYAMGNAVDLSKSQDHQNATMMFYDQQLPMQSVKSIKRKTKPQKSLNASKLRQVSSNGTSNKSQSHSHHPIFRDTLDYVEANRFNLQENFSEHPNQDRYSDGSSISSNGPHTNVDKKESYAYKYKKYKKKTIILQKTMKELEKHNELLLKDMRRNFQYYESQLRDRENTILMKDKQIAQFRHALLVTTNTTTSSQNDHNATSMETRHLESELQRCKKIIQGKQNELKILRNNFQAKEESFQAADQAKNKKIESLEKKLEHSKTKDEYFRNKIESLEKHNALLQQKLKEKEERYFKHQEDLLEAQQQLVALQSRLRAEETSDTQRTFGHQQGQKQKYLINETFSKLPQQEQVQKQQKNSDFEHQFSQIYDAMNKLRTSMGVGGKLPFVKQTKNSPNKKQYQIDCVDDQDNQYVLDQGYDDQVFMQMKKNCGRSFDSRNNFME